MIHKYTLFGYNIVLDTESGAVHVVSEIAMKMLDYLKIMLEKNNYGDLPEECPVDIRYFLAKYESSEIKETYAELRELYINQMLFSRQVSISMNYNEEVPIKALCLNISHACNMSCEYCFAGKGDYGTSESLMSEETGMNAVKFLIEKSKSRRNLEIDFFGGEPLLNFDTVKNIVAKTRELEKEYNKNVRFTLTTNGTLLDDDKIDFINNNISNIVLSLDGLQETNDNMRKYNGADDESVYSEIVPLYQRLIERRTNPQYKDYYIRGTFTRKNLNFAKDVVHMRELGFINVSVEPVVAEEDNDYSIRKEDLPVIFKEYETLAKEIIKRERKHENIFNFFHFNIDLENGPCVYKRSKGCGSGSEYVAVTPSGDIYPCHQFVGNEKYKIGNVNDKDVKLDKNLMKEFYNNNIITNEICKKCWAKYFCGGGCAANNEKFGGKINQPYEISCEMEKKRVECAIAIKAVLSV